jgi:curved DNA-binding protein CbpA
MATTNNTKLVDYYLFFQINPQADHETIHRVYRFLAARFHPDNQDTGNPEMFELLQNGYEILSNPARRAEYDAFRERDEQSLKLVPLSTSIDFMDSLDGELNRRLAVLAVLYIKRRSTPHLPEVTLLEIETRLGFPRDYLDFTMWYLLKKGYITRGDNMSSTLTAEGVDFIETQRTNIPVLNKLLTSGEGTPTVVHPTGNSRVHTPPPPSPHNETTRVHAGDPQLVERRVNKRDRRVNSKDRRLGA